MLAAIGYGKENLIFSKILAITTPDNEGLIRLLEKLGFKFEQLINLPQTGERVKLFSFNA